MKRKFSAADCFYDSFCTGYTLRYQNAGEFCTGNMKVSSYRVEGRGAVTLVRVSGPLGKLTEAGIFVPEEKDAPVFMMDRVKTIGKDAMSLNILEANLTKLYYRQFLNVSEDYGKIPDAEVPEGWYAKSLIQGSTAKNIQGHPEAESMLEDYIAAFMKVLEFAEPCAKEAKGEKIREIRENFLSDDSQSVRYVMKALGEEKGKRFFSEVLFPAE